jgi:hypothetical protein
MNKVRPGDPVAISAAVWNDVLDAAALAKRTKRAGAGIPDGLEVGIVRVKNTTEEDLDRFAALGIAFGIGVPPDKNELAFQNEPPVLFGGVYEGDGPWVVLMEPLPAGKIGRGMLFGVTPAQVDIADEEHEFAEPVQDNAAGTLQSCATGTARILWKPGKTGLQWCILHVGAGSGAAGDPSVCPAVVYNFNEGVYTVELYADGILSPKTGRAQLMLPEVSMLSHLDSGSVVLAHLVDVGIADHEVEGD